MTKGRFPDICMNIVTILGDMSRDVGQSPLLHVSPFFHGDALVACQIVIHEKKKKEKEKKKGKWYSINHE